VQSGQPRGLRGLRRITTEMTGTKRAHKQAAEQARRLAEAMSLAIDNIIEEIQKPVNHELSGSARKAELQAIAIAAKEAKALVVERRELLVIIEELDKGLSSEKTGDFGIGFAEHAAG